MGDEDDRLAYGGLQAQELVLEAFAVDGIDGAERLVHEHQRRIARERAGDAHPLALAAGELGRVAVTHLLRIESDQLEELVAAPGDPRPIPTQEPRHGGDVLADGLMREQADLLDHVADLSPQLIGTALEHAALAEEDVAAGRLDHAVD